MSAGPSGPRRRIEGSLAVRKIALEEHFLAPGFEDYFATTAVNLDAGIFQGAKAILSDFGGRRLEEMDRHGIDFAVLSLAGPGVQAERDATLAVRRAREVNDFLAREVQRRPGRFGGFAHLAMQDPQAAADELERSVRELGLKGAMINGQTNGDYLDADRFAPFWERLQALQVPVYIHPANPVDEPYMYTGHPELFGPTWSWTVETATHVLRLVFGGVFDRFPEARLIVGHMGETLPYLLWRLDSRWQIAKHGRTLQRLPSDYIKGNVTVTTSGVFSDAPLVCALSALGEDKVMFSVDYPFEATAAAVAFIAQAPIGDETRAKVCHLNAERLLAL